MKYEEIKFKVAFTVILLTIRRIRNKMHNNADT